MATSFQPIYYQTTGPIIQASPSRRYVAEPTPVRYTATGNHFTPAAPTIVTGSRVSTESTPVVRPSNSRSVTPTVIYAPRQYTPISAVSRPTVPTAAVSSGVSFAPTNAPYIPIVSAPQAPVVHRPVSVQPIASQRSNTPVSIYTSQNPYTNPTSRAFNLADMIQGQGQVHTMQPPVENTIQALQPGTVPNTPVMRPSMKNYIESVRVQRAEQDAAKHKADAENARNRSQEVEQRLLEAKKAQEEAEARLEQERRKAEDERRKVEDERKKIELDLKRAEDARFQAEREKEDAQQKAERAELEKQQAKKQAEEVERQLSIIGSARNSIDFNHGAVPRSFQLTNGMPPQSSAPAAYSQYATTSIASLQATQGNTGFVNTNGSVIAPLTTHVVSPNGIPETNHVAYETPQPQARGFTLPQQNIPPQQPALQTSVIANPPTASPAFSGAATNTHQEYVNTGTFQTQGSFRNSTINPLTGKPRSGSPSPSLTSIPSISNISNIPNHVPVANPTFGSGVSTQSAPRSLNANFTNPAQSSQPQTYPPQNTEPVANPLQYAAQTYPSQSTVLQSISAHVPAPNPAPSPVVVPPAATVSINPLTGKPRSASPSLSLAPGTPNLGPNVQPVNPAPVSISAPVTNPAPVAIPAPVAVPVSNNVLSSSTRTFDF